MNLQLDPHVKAVFDDIVAHTPDIGPTPSGEIRSSGTDHIDAGRRWSAVAAAAVLVIGVGAVIAVQRTQSRSTDDVPVTQPSGDEAADRAPGGMMLLDPLPAALSDADVSAFPGPPPVAVPVAPEQGWIRRWYTTTMERPELAPHLDVSSVSAAHQIPPPNVDEATVVTVQGVDGWLYDDLSGPGRSVSFHDGQTMFVLTGYQLSDDELLVAAENAVAADDGGVGAVIDSAALPPGLVERAVGTVFEKDFLPLEIQRHESPTIRWDTDDVSVWLKTVTEDPALVPLHRLGFDTVTDTTVRDHPAFVTSIAEQPSYVGVTWSENGITYLLGSNGLDQDSVVGYAHLLRPATRAEWDSLISSPEAPLDDAPDPTVAPRPSVPTTDSTPTAPTVTTVDSGVAPVSNDPVVVANASDTAGIAGSTQRHLELGGYRVLGAVNAASSLGTLQTSIVYARAGHEALGNEIAERFGISTTETVAAGALLPIDGSDIDHDDVAVLVVLGRDFVFAPDPHTITHANFVDYVAQAREIFGDVSIGDSCQDWPDRDPIDLAHLVVVPASNGDGTPCEMRGWTYSNGKAPDDVPPDAVITRGDGSSPGPIFDDDGNVIGHFDVEDTVDTVDAAVVGRVADDSTRIEIGRGVTDGVRVGMPVVDASGLVGEIASVTDTTSVVILVASPDFEIGARLVRPGDPAQVVAGVLAGQGANQPMRFSTAEPRFGEIAVGDLALTSGGRQALVPADIPIGVATAIGQLTAEGEADLVVEVEPNGDLESMESVQVLLYQPAGE